MTRLAFDIYPPPVTSLGSRLVRLTNQHYAGGTTYIHGRPMGQGTIVVEKGNSWVTATNFAVGNYVIVRDLDISEVSDSLNVLGGFFLEEGDFLLVSDDPKVLTFSGRSTIVILERAILGPEALSEFAGPNDIIDGYWRWGSDTYGGVMRRAIYEANLQTPAGLPMFDTDLTGSDSVKWDDAEDSNGVAWPAFAGEYRTQCGTTLLELYRELYGYGVELEIDARTFDIYAYNPDGYGTDRTSATFGAGKVRFVAGVNIAADLSRQIRGTLRRTHLLVRTTDWPQGGWIESDDYSPGDPIYKGVYQTGDISGDPSASAVIDSRAQRNMDLRTLSEDAVRIPLHEPGDDEANGRYTPGPNYTPGPTATTGHFWTGDLITLDTGDHTMDYQDASKRVEAVEYVLREAGDWQAIVHLGPRSWLSNSSIPPLAGATAHTLPLELCQATIPPGADTPGATVWTYSWDFETDNLDTGTGTVHFMPGRINSPGALSGWWGNSGGGTNTGTVEKLPVTAGQTLRVDGDFCKSRLTTVSTSWFSVQWFADIVDINPASTTTVGIAASGSGPGVVAAVDESLIVPAGIEAIRVKVDNNLFADNLTISLTGAATPGTAGTPGAGHVDLVGTGTGAARCDHKHHVLRETPPGPSDDDDHGYPAGTQWIVVDDVDNPTVIYGRWRSLDDTTDAAVWVVDSSGDESADAASVSYDNTTSGLTADNVQDAIDELATDVAEAEHTHGGFTVGIVSNPPTQAEIETLIGPATTPGETYGIQDSGTEKRYLAMSDGLRWVIVPLVNPRQQGGVAALTSAPNGGWAASHSAFYYNGKTYFVYVRGDNGNVELRTYTHSTDAVSSATVLRASLDAETHAAPSLVVRQSDHRIHTFYSSHAGAQMYQWISTNPEDISAGTETNIDSQLGGTGYTYPLVADLTSGLYLIVRPYGGAGVDQVWSYSVTTDDGATWSALTDFYTVAGRTAYPFLRKTGADRIDFIATDGSSLQASTSAQFFSWIPGDNAWTSADGTPLTLPIGDQPHIMAWDGSTLDDVRWRGDVGRGSDDRPRIIIATLNGSTLTYRHGRWDGSDWVFTALSAGSNPPAPGAAFDSLNANVLYLTDGSEEMVRFETLDEATWSSTVLTTGTQSIYPISPVDHAADLPVVWLTGTYNASDDFSLGVTGFGASTADADTDSLQRIVILDDDEAGEAVLRRTAAGAWEISRDDGAEWESLGSSSSSAGVGPILITDTPAGSPLIFADLLQNDDGDDLLYADI